MITEKTTSNIMLGVVCVWKCYRCNLYFKDEAHAHMHEVVMNHSAAKIQLAAT